MGVGVSSYSVKDLEEVLLGHVRRVRDLLAVASAMAALQVAAQSTLPKELQQRMIRRLGLPDGGRNVQCNPPSERYFCHYFFLSLWVPETVFSPVYQCLSPSFV